MRWIIALGLAISVGCAKESKDQSETKTSGTSQTEAQPDQGKPPTPKGPLTWLTDEKKALALAAERKRPVLIDFGAKWCAPCVEYEEKVFTDAGVIERLSAMVLLRIDVTEQTPADEEIQERYKATMLPTLVGLSTSGEEEVRITRLLNPEEFLAAIAKLE